MEHVLHFISYILASNELFTAVPASIPVCMASVCTNCRAEGNKRSAHIFAIPQMTTWGPTKGSVKYRLKIATSLEAMLLLPSFSDFLSAFRWPLVGGRRWKRCWWPSGCCLWQCDRLRAACLGCHKPTSPIALTLELMIAHLLGLLVGWAVSLLSK